MTEAVVGSLGETIATPSAPAAPVAPIGPSNLGAPIAQETATVIPAAPGGRAPRAIDKIRAAFGDKSWKLYVPEWDMDVYFRPLTMADIEAVRLAQGPQPTNPDGTPAVQDSPQVRQINLLVHKARDGNGRPLFFPGDKMYLMTEARADVVQRVCDFMFACGSLTLDEARQTLGNGSTSATPSS